MDEDEEDDEKDFVRLLVPPTMDSLSSWLSPAVAAPHS